MPYPSRHTTSFQRLYDVYTTSATSYRRRIDVETTSCVFWDMVIMPISIMQWCVEIGMFSPTYKTRFINLKSLRAVGLSSGFRLGIRFVFVFLILFACDDIELNPGPKKGAPATVSQFAIGIETASLHTILQK